MNQYILHCTHCDPFPVLPSDDDTYEYKSSHKRGRPRRKQLQRENDSGMDCTGRIQVVQCQCDMRIMRMSFIGKLKRNKRKYTLAFKRSSRMAALASYVLKSNHFGIIFDILR